MFFPRSIGLILLFSVLPAIGGELSPPDNKGALVDKLLGTALCQSMSMYVEFYVSFRTTGEPESESQKRYLDIRATTSDAAADTAADLGLRDGVANARYVDATVRGATLADAWLKAHRSNIETAVVALRGRTDFDWKTERLSEQVSSSAGDECFRELDLPRN